MSFLQPCHKFTAINIYIYNCKFTAINPVNFGKSVNYGCVRYFMEFTAFEKLPCHKFTAAFTAVNLQPKSCKDQ